MSERYSDQEHRIMCRLFGDGLMGWQIAERLNALPANVEQGIIRTAPGVLSRCRSLGLSRRERRIEEDPNNRNGDMLFQDAVKRAINLGVERVREGVFHDPTPFVGRMIHPEPIFSGCSSAAGLCAEFGDQHAAEWEPA